MGEKCCANCMNWEEDLEFCDGDGACSKRAEYGGLTKFDFVCDKYRYDYLIPIKILIYKIKCKIS